MRSWAIAIAATMMAGCGSDAPPDGLPVEFSLTCQALENGTLLEYQVVGYRDASMWVSCSASDGYVEAGEAAYWLASQDGASDGYCAVTLDDYGDVSGGWWEFTIATDGHATAVYHDPGDTADGSSVTFRPADCTYIAP